MGVGHLQDLAELVAFLGTLLYEMLTGDPPFYAPNSKKLYKKIMTTKPKYPRWLSGECHSVLKGFLERNRNAFVEVNASMSALAEMCGTHLPAPCRRARRLGHRLRVLHHLEKQRGDAEVAGP